ncbi:MAG: hypothetical protein DMF96_24955 [Acidobacteria bacterium]|nr:MAG: hypothetical protein DMF96_24955 [Acidobacteriota bacterium]
MLETTAARRQLLTLTERFHGGWRAMQDDREREATRVYGDFLGCIVDPGRHLVRFTFAPASFSAGVRTSLASLAALILTLVSSTLLCGPRVTLISTPSGKKPE